MTRAAAHLLALAAAIALAVAAPALAATPRASLPDIEDEVMCVTCNVPLNTAESPQASRQRAFIRAEIAKGKTKPQIKAALVEQYGKNVLAMPEGDDGVGAAAYVVPIAVVVLLGGAVALLLPRWRRRAAATAASGPSAPAGGAVAASEAELRRLDEDLRRLD